MEPEQESVLRNSGELNTWRQKIGQVSGEVQLALVPTMGALHEGHLTLIREARRYASHVLVSIFVNPTQFNDPLDFERYPREEAQDIKAAFSAGADAVFLPTPEVIYPRGAQTSVKVGSLANVLCGATRPGHFEGVCTVVTALFNLTRCDVALFGQKDYQQLTIIQQMTRDLHLPIHIIGVPTQRAPDGVALSSRNARLSVRERAIAPKIYQGLQAAASCWRAGERDVSILRNTVINTLDDEFMLDYLELCDRSTLTPLKGLIPQYDEALLAIACFIGEVRLIDHIMLR